MEEFHMNQKSQKQSNSRDQEGAGGGAVVPGLQLSCAIPTPSSLPSLPYLEGCTSQSPSRRPESASHFPGVSPFWVLF